METGVANNGLASMLNHAAGPADLLSGAEHGDAERRRIAFGVGDDLHRCWRLPSSTMVRHGVRGWGVTGSKVGSDVRGYFDASRQPHAKFNCCRYLTFTPRYPVTRRQPLLSSFPSSSPQPTFCVTRCPTSTHRFLSDTPPSITPAGRLSLLFSRPTVSSALRRQSFPTLS